MKALLARTSAQAKILGAVAIVILIACVTVTENQLRFWRDTETLFTHALKVTQKNGLAHMMLGVARER